jgi:hypothetical protein
MASISSILQPAHPQWRDIRPQHFAIERMAEGEHRPVHCLIHRKNPLILQSLHQPMADDGLRYLQAQRFTDGQQL